MHNPTDKSKLATPRGQRIDRAIKRTGIAVVSQAFGITAWAAYRWARMGYVPNERLTVFCALTGEKHHLVCDPVIAHLLEPLARNKSDFDTTKNSKAVKEVV